MEKRLNDEDYYRKVYFQDSFHAQCMDVDPLTMLQFDRAAAQVRSVLKNEKVIHAKKIIATGCGDSNIAAFAVKDAFEHYLPDVRFEAVEAIELSRHYEFESDESRTIMITISVSGGIYRTIEALRQCKKRGIITVAMTGNENSLNAEEADILYYLNCPPGDNNAGLRTYYMNVIGMIVLAAGIAEIRNGTREIERLRAQLVKYHDDFWKRVNDIEDAVFEAAIHWIDKKYIEICGDGPLFWAGKFIQAKLVELSGDPCTVIDSENYMHVNSLMRSDGKIMSLVLAPGYASSLANIITAVNNMVDCNGREVLLFSDRRPEEIGVNVPVRYCPLPVPDSGWELLTQVYSYLPGAMFAAYRHTIIGEPMFRGGMDPTIFIPTYFSPIHVV